MWDSTVRVNVRHLEKVLGLKPVYGRCNRIVGYEKEAK